MRWKVGADDSAKTDGAREEEVCGKRRKKRFYVVEAYGVALEVSDVHRSVLEGFVCVSPRVFTFARLEAHLGADSCEHEVLELFRSVHVQTPYS
jgi:hypothetical protein